MRKIPLRGVWGRDGWATGPREMAEPWDTIANLVAVGCMLAFMIALCALLSGCGGSTAKTSGATRDAGGFGYQVREGGSVYFYRTALDERM